MTADETDERMASMRRYDLYKHTRMAPAWGHAVDCDTAVELTLNLFDRFYGPEAKLTCEDSRSLFSVIMELCDIVAERNGISDKAHWAKTNNDFLEEIAAVSNTFLRICEEFEPNWINTKYHRMYGTEYVIDLFKRYQHVAELELAGARKESSQKTCTSFNQPTTADVLASPFNPVVRRSKSEEAEREEAGETESQTSVQSDKF